MVISMPKLNGLDATQQILQVLPATRVLILSSHSGEAYVESAMAIGAAGYIDKLTSIHYHPIAITETHARRSGEITQRHIIHGCL